MARIKSGVGGPVGAAAPVQPAAAPMMTDYVSTRYYRAPEIITNAGMYDGAVDMWSVGCILAELVSGRILFTGHNHLMQVMLITQLLGMPTTEFLQAIPSEGTRNFMSSIPKFLALQGQPAPTRRPLSTVTYKNAAGVDVPMFGTFTQADPEIDLLERIFVFDPRQRITAAQALQHPYFASLHVRIPSLSVQRRGMHTRAHVRVRLCEFSSPSSYTHNHTYTYTHTHIYMMAMCVSVLSAY